MRVGSDRLNVVVHAGTGPYALVVHGALGSRSYWADNVGALASVCRPVVVELWGHGRSASPTDPDAYHPDRYVACFDRLRADLGAEQWATIGQSMGAALTLRYGLAHPERVRAQVITNTTSALSRTAGWGARHRDNVLPLADKVRREGTGFLADHAVNPGRSRQIAAATRARMAAEFAEHDAHGIASTLAFTNAHLPVEHRLEEISPPTLLTFGVQETAFAPLAQRARRIPRLETVEIDAAHAVNAQNPSAWNAAVVEFLGRTLTDRPGR